VVKEIWEEQVLLAVKEERKLLPRSGCRKMQKLVNSKLECKVGRDRLFELLRSKRMLVLRRKKFVKTTYSRHSYAVQPNSFANLEICKVGQAVVADITYIRVGEGFGYLFLLTDAFSRRVVGWEFSKSMAHTAAVRVLEKARESYDDIRGLVHHSDRGSQYCCHEFLDAMYSLGLVSSMTDADHSAQNAMAERMNGILKDEFFLDICFNSFEQARVAIANAIQIYNTYRPHQSLNWNTPDSVHFAEKTVRASA
jgi:transposase InsO family protein